MSERGKVTEEHRRRRAVVYVRQSSVGQVERNTESAARQYALRERAVELGWPAGSVAVLDEDTGRSGASSDGRLGFRELVAEVGLGHVGLILALETSRLARCSAGWHRLLDLCALTGTLIADADGVYSPADFNDRLLLGLKGTMSEAELHFIRARLIGGLRNKAARGELRLPLPVGLDRDDDDRVMLCPDEQVRHAIDRVFVLWRALGSARQVALELIAEGEQLPRRTVGQRRIRWARASMARCTTSSPTRRMRARSCSAASDRSSASTSTGRCASPGSTCRPRSGLSACPITIPAMSAGMRTSPLASGCERT
jgi:DNA invertase Pin-like site-specific DNA recombinase